LVNELENLKIRHVDIQTEYKVIKTLLGEKGASEKAARAIFELNSNG
jgi:hypothetical protein